MYGVTASPEFGWTDFTASGDSRIVYVSSSDGNDSNDGLSSGAPKATIAAGYSLLRHGYPDWLLLKRGDTWSETLGHWKKSGRSASEKMVVGTYGTATARPLLNTGSAGYAITRTGGGGSPATIDHVAFVGFECHANGRTASEDTTGFRWLGPGRDVLIEDCCFRGYGFNISVQADGNGRPSNVVINRCSILDSFNGPIHSSGLYANWVDGLTVKECFFDHNGWNTDESADPTIYNHNMYIATGCTNVRLLRNISSQASSHGAQLRCGGIIDGNVVFRCPIGLLLGGGDPVDASHLNGVYGTVTNNVILEGTDISPSLLRGTGIEFSNIGRHGAVCSGNIIANKYTSSNGSCINFNANGYGAGVGCNNVTVSDNIIYDWRGGVTTSAAAGSPPSPSSFTGVSGLEFNDNDFQEPSSSGITALLSINSASPVTLDGNRYSSQRSSGQWFAIGGTDKSYAQWVSDTGETNSSSTTVSYAAPTRSVAGYHATLGGDETVDALITSLRAQNRQNWSQSLTASAIRSYVLAGFAE